MTAASLLVGFACEEPAPCEEDIRAQRLDDEVLLQVGAEAIDVEVADEPTERDRGWMHRRCDRRGLLLVPDAPDPLPIWGCELVDPVDLHFIREGEVVDVVRTLMPCDSPCGECPVVGDDITVDAVLETLAGSITADVGARVQGLP